jgi:hypothetical protein
MASGAATEQHHTSIAHLFDLQFKPPQRSTTLPTHNKGYQMLTRTLGWSDTDGRGLGKDGAGSLEPVKTTFRGGTVAGLGHPAVSLAPRVTHFPSALPGCRGSAAKHAQDRLGGRLGMPRKLAHKRKVRGAAGAGESKRQRAQRERQASSRDRLTRAAVYGSRDLPDELQAILDG